MKTLCALLLLSFGAARFSTAAEPVWVWLGVPPDIMECLKRQGESDDHVNIAKGALRVLCGSLPVPGSDYDKLLFQHRIIDSNQSCTSGEHQDIYHALYAKAMDAEIERCYGKKFWVRFGAELAALRAAPNKPLPPIAPKDGAPVEWQR